VEQAGVGGRLWNNLSGRRRSSPGFAHLRAAL